MSDANDLGFFGELSKALPVLAMIAATMGVGNVWAASISGRVGADNAAVVGVQVKAKHLTQRITYTVFSKVGRYHVPDLDAGSYEVWAVTDERESARYRVDVPAKAAMKLDIELKPKPTQAMELVEYDQLYPPGPGRDLLEKTCMVCHGKFFYQTQPRPVEGWRAAVSMMTDPYPTHPGSAKIKGVSAGDREAIAQYLAANFGTSPQTRDLKRDRWIIDEDAVSQAIYIEYDLPPSKVQPQHPHRVHDALPVKDGTLWFTDVGANVIFHFDPKVKDWEKRYREYELPNKNAYVHGLAVGADGHVWWAQINGGDMGELDPKTGKIRMHETTRGMSMLQNYLDSKGNVWFALVHGNKLGKIEPKTGKVSQWEIPAFDTGPYGLVIDKNDELWSAAITRNLIVRFDPKREKFTLYKTPTQPSGPRRLGVDSKGIIWFSEFLAGNLGRIDPKSGEVTELKAPLAHTHPYEAWPVGDEIWMSETAYNTMLSYNQKTHRWTYVPMPQPNPSGVPKVEVDRGGVIWFGMRTAPNNAVFAFKPRGNRVWSEATK